MTSVACSAGGLDINKVFDGTWHDATGRPEIGQPAYVDIAFNGKNKLKPAFMLMSYN